MTLQERFFELSARLRDQADAYAQRAAMATREGIDRAARQVEALDRPLDTLALAGLELNQISAKYVAQLVTHQTAASRALVRDGAARLRSLAEAESLSEAWRDQASSFADTRGQAIETLRHSWELTAAAGREVAELATSTLRGLTAPAPHGRRARGQHAAAGTKTARKARAPRRASGTRGQSGSRPARKARSAAATRQ